MKLTIMTPLNKFLETEVREVYLPGFMGEFGVLKGHAQMVASLCEGKCRYRSESGEEKKITIGKGVVRIFGDSIEVLADKAVSSSSN